MEHNLQLKIEICEAAESLMNSEEWKKATDERIAPSCARLEADRSSVSRRHSDAVWKRFRAACDKFFGAQGVALREGRRRSTRRTLQKKTSALLAGKWPGPT